MSSSIGDTRHYQIRVYPSYASMATMKMYLSWQPVRYHQSCAILGKKQTNPQGISTNIIAEASIKKVTYYNPGKILRKCKKEFASCSNIVFFRHSTARSMEVPTFYARSKGVMCYYNTTFYI